MNKKLIVEYDVYKVSDESKAISDETWYEYRVELVAIMTEPDSSLVVLDKWDSRLETYNGVEDQRLTERKARHTCEEIKEDVEHFDKASHWFDV